MKENDSVILIIIFSCFLLVMVVSFFMMFNTYHKNLRLRQKEAMSNLILGQDNERERIARDLHDDMGLELASIYLAMDDIKSSSQAIIEAKQRTKQRLLEVSEGIRQISHDLMPMSLTRYGLAESISELKDKYKKAFTIDFITNCENERFKSNIELHLYRIVKELMQNTQKHSGGDTINIGLSYNTDTKQIELGYRDNGKGFGLNNEKKMGMGLKNITTRVQLLDGDIKIYGTEGFNTIIVIPA
jgi:signal transduction histidine kinase